jgi:hypothetical protein
MSAVTSHKDAETRRMQTAFALAQEASKAAAQAVLETFLNERKGPIDSRFMLVVDDDDMTCRVRPINYGAIIATPARLAEMLVDPGMSISNQELINIARACMQQIKERIVK